MNQFRQSLALAVLLVCWRCAAREAPRPREMPAPSTPPAAAQGEALPGPPAPARTGPGIDIKPNWPAGWKVVDAGRAGADPRPLIWFRLEVGRQTAEEAVRQTLGALRPVSGPFLMQDTAVSQSRAEAIGHFRGARLRGVVQAAAAREATEVRVTLEPAP